MPYQPKEARAETAARDLAQLDRLARKAGLDSLHAVFDAAKVDKSILRRWRSGDRYPTPETVQKLRNAVEGK